MSEPLRWGVLSTARINELVLAGARTSEQVEVFAVASRDRETAEAYAREHGIERAHGSYDALLADQRTARRVDDSRAAGGQARALREAAQPPQRRCRARLRRRRALRAAADG